MGQPDPRLIRGRLVAAITALSLSLSCSAGLQNGVRSSGTACDTGFFWIASDLLIAGAWAYVVSRAGSDSAIAAPGGLIPSGVFGTSALIGIYKHHNCVRLGEDLAAERVRRDLEIEANRVPLCTGGEHLVGKGCYCAAGMTWNGLACQGTPDAGTCAGGGYPFGPEPASCFCLDGSRWDGAQCVELACTGGAVAMGNACGCPNGTQWDGGQCAVVQLTCQSNMIVAGDQCVCPDGTQWDGGQCSVPAEPAADESSAASPCPEGSVLGGPFNDQCKSCSGGAVPGGLYNQECLCPDGTAWNGSECRVPGSNVASPPPPAPRQTPPRHHRERPQPVAPPPPQRQIAPRQPPPPPAPNPAYHAMFQQSAAGPANRCQLFDQAPSNMGACSAWCTGLLVRHLRCQCAGGGCP